jgi:hypothetical protein
MLVKISCNSFCFNVLYKYGVEMSKQDKLVERLLARPTDFTYEELTTLLSRFGYTKLVSGSTSGSRVAFTNSEGDYIRIHKPHPRNILKRYQIDNIIAALSERGLM